MPASCKAALELLMMSPLLELMAAIRQELHRIIADRGEELGVFFLTHVRNFDEWTGPMVVHPFNAWLPRDQVDVPHSFSYKLRADLTPDECSWLRCEPTDHGFPVDDLDVFCIVKEFMHSRRANGPPVLILPDCRFLLLATPGPIGTHYKTKGMSGARRENLKELAEALEDLTRHWRPQHSYVEAAADLRVLAQGRPPERAPPGWLEAFEDPSVGHLPATDNPYFGFLPGVSWRLLVDFH
jgi:hypothetical protein